MNITIKLLKSDKTLNYNSALIIILLNSFHMCLFLHTSINILKKYFKTKRLNSWSNKWSSKF